MANKLELLSFPDGKVIFRQGDNADCMYKVKLGLVDIYMNYKQDNQKLLATIQEDQFFGELALIDDTVRTATAVARSEETRLEVYPKSELNELLTERTDDFRDLLSQMTSNLVHLTDNYADVCRTIAEYKKCDDNGDEISRDLQESIDRYAYLYLK